jgi:pimeloyl-ACP methyl ester carboxylesterase
MVSKALSWTKKINSRTEKFQLKLAVHPFTNGKIIVNHPGVGGSLDGYNNKYKALAGEIVQRGLSAVVRTPNPPVFGFGWDMNLRQVLSFVLLNSKKICGSERPELFLMGTSAGAGAVASLVWEYPEITKILLLEPAILPGENLIKTSLSKYRGEIYVVVGSRDSAFGREIGERFINYSTSARRKELFEIPDCDHHFSGEKNGRIFSQAPFYAFSDKPKPRFPDLKGGIKLYD